MNTNYTKRRKAFHNVKAAHTGRTHTGRFRIASGNARNLIYHKNKKLSENKLDGKGIRTGVKTKKSANLRLSCLEALRKPCL